MKQHVLKLTVIGALALTSLTACMNNRDGVGTTDQVRNQSVRPYGNGADRLGMNRWDNPRGTNFTSRHNNTRMEMSQDIADRIAAMGDVDSAYVLLTDKNAYVGVVLNNNNRNALGTRGNMNMTTPNGNLGTNGNMNRGTTNRPYTGFGAALNERETGMNGTAANDIPESVKTRISGVVKSMHPGVRNVFISADPGFVDRLNGYSVQFRNGKPIRGMILEFNNMVQRMFPDRVRTDVNRPDIPNPNPVRGTR